MKAIWTLAFFFLILSCRTIPLEKKILGDWEIKTWIDSRTNEDIIKSPNIVNYRVVFIPDTVFVEEKDSAEIHHYRFKWKLQNDTILVRSIGMFKIVSINRKRCVFELTTFDDIFNEGSKLHKEILTMKKNRTFANTQYAKRRSAY